MFISRLVEVPVPDDGGLHVCLSACGLLLDNLLFSSYKLKGLCHQIMFVLGVWWCVNRYMMCCHCDGCALVFAGYLVVIMFCCCLTLAG